MCDSLLLLENHSQQLNKLYFGLHNLDKAVVVVFESDFAVMDGTARAANSDTINKNHPDLLPILIDPQTFIAIMMLTS